MDDGTRALAGTRAVCESRVVPTLSRMTYVPSALVFLVTLDNSRSVPPVVGEGSVTHNWGFRRTKDEKKS